MISDFLEWPITSSNPVDINWLINTPNMYIKSEHLFKVAILE